jgi:hypothetical protein
LLMESQLVTSYTLKHDVNRCFRNPAWSKCKHVYKPVVSFIKKRICQYIYIRMIVLLLIIILQFKNSYDYEISQKR